MKKEDYRFSFEIYDSIEELNEEDAQLLKEAQVATKNAHAPYSHFRVGAVARLTNGETVSGSNQENVSFPIGLCAERVLLATAASLFSKVPIETMAISYNNVNGDSDHPISPCGMCRQSLLEYEVSLQHSIRLILAGQKGKVYLVERAAMLLPLSFTDKDLTL